MKLSNMFKKTSRRGYISLGEGKPAHMAPEVPEGLLKKCNVCKSAILTEDVKNGYYICPKCQNYFRVHAMHRIEMVADAGTFEEWDKGLTSGNPLHYKGYEEKVEALQEKTGLDEAVVTGKARIAGNEVVLAVCDGRFMMASMGKVVGEKITRAVEKATSERIPIIIFACSGGARMQEGIHSLMQMAKTSAALKRHHDAGLQLHFFPVPSRHIRQRRAGHRCRLRFGKFRCILCDFNGIPVTFIHDDLADRTSENLRQECQYILHLTVQCLRPPYIS